MEHYLNPTLMGEGSPELKGIRIIIRGTSPLHMGVLIKGGIQPHFDVLEV
jgi:hypothetical protein